MKKIVLFLVIVATIFSACKKEEPVSNQQFVQNYIVGKWPFKVLTAITTKNGMRVDSTTKIYGGIDSPRLVVDTVQFTAEGKYLKKNDTLNYTINATGDSITYSRDTIDKWKIKFLRLKSIILIQEKTEIKGSDTFIYYKEQQLIRN